MRVKTMGSVLLVGALLSGCGPQMGQKQGIGTILGGIGGAVIGAQFGGGAGQLVATAVGTMAGAFIGNQIGASLDRADAAYLNQATQQALVSGHSTQWQNAQNGHYGGVSIAKSYQSSHGEYCREYQQVVTINGQQQKAYGTACRQPDGSWQIVGS